MGGNLSMVYESIGAENEIDTRDTILFLEDVGEQLYSVDRIDDKTGEERKTKAGQRRHSGQFHQYGKYQRLLL